MHKSGRKTLIIINNSLKVQDDVWQNRVSLSSSLVWGIVFIPVSGNSVQIQTSQNSYETYFIPGALSH